MRRPRITYANTMATLALMLAVGGGTAVAAVVLTGRNVADRSVTGADIKSASLAVGDLAPAAKASLVGQKGPTGRPGANGSAGLRGPDGGQGPRGSAAFMSSAFGYRDTGLVVYRVGANPPNNNGGTGKDWDDPTYASSAAACAPGGCPQIRPASNGYNQVNLGASYQPVLALTGMSGSDVARSTDSMLNVSFSDAYLQATASLTLLHRANGESLETNTGGALLHGRAECALFYGTSGDPNALTQMAGVPALVSSGYGDALNAPNHELVNVSLTGNAAGLAPGAQYNVTVKCRDADYTGNPQWQLSRGNLTALGSR